MAALNAQDNFKIRLVDPSTICSPQAEGYALDFMYMNRRMHNKSFIVDSKVAIIGGRNIGDEYFRVGDANYYIWMCWASVRLSAKRQRLSMPIGTAPRSLVTSRSFQAEAGVAKTAETPAAKTLVGQLESNASRFASGEVKPEFTRVEVVADDAVKGARRSASK